MAKHTPNTVPIESDSLRSDIRHVLELAAEGAEELEIVGRAISDAIAETGRTDPADELRERAVRLRTGARQATEIAGAIQAAAGRLEGLSLARRIIEGELDAVDAASNSRSGS